MNPNSVFMFMLLIFVYNAGNEYKNLNFQSAIIIIAYFMQRINHARR